MNVHNNEIYQKLIDEIEEISHMITDTDSFQKKLDELETIANQNNDDILKTVVLFHKSDIPYQKGDFEESENYIKQTLQLAQEINFSFYIMRSYNSLAIFSSECSDYYSAISNYLKAFQIAEIHPEFQFGCVLLNNIGNLFVWLNEHEIALDYLLESYEKFHKEQIDSEYIRSVILMNIVEEYSLLNNYEKAKEWAAIEVESSEAKDIINVIISINEIDLCYQQKQFAEVSKRVEEILNVANEEENYIYFFRSYLRLLKYAVMAKDEHIAKNIFERTEYMNKTAKISTFSYDYAEIKYFYYEAFQKGSDIVETVLSDYVKASMQTIEQLRNTYTRRLVIETELLKVTNEKETAISQSKQLQKDIELDYFTKILNKVSFEKYVNLEIENKKESEEFIQALLIIDIDYFKFVNDTYGHDRGDELILEVVEMIASSCSKNMLFGRFGGDEFILFIKNVRNLNFITFFAEELLEKARQIKIDQNRNLTLSIGAHIIPNDSDFKEAFQKADNALYETKRKGRDGYSVYTEKK